MTRFAQYALLQGMAAVQGTAFQASPDPHQGMREQLQSLLTGRIARIVPGEIRPDEMARHDSCDVGCRPGRREDAASEGFKVFRVPTLHGEPTLTADPSRGHFTFTAMPAGASLAK